MGRPETEEIRASRPAHFQRALVAVLQADRFSRAQTGSTGSHAPGSTYVPASESCSAARGGADEITYHMIRHNYHFVAADISMSHGPLRPHTPL